MESATDCNLTNNKYKNNRQTFSRMLFILHKTQRDGQKFEPDGSKMSVTAVALLKLERDGPKNERDGPSR